MLDTGLSLAANDAEVPWQTTAWPGISWTLLASDGDGGNGASRGATVLIRMEPGHGYPAHEHLDVEDVLVLAGAYQDELGQYGPGSFIRYPSGSRHTPIALGDSTRSADRGNPACILFASTRGGIEIDP